MSKIVPSHTLLVMDDRASGKSGSRGPRYVNAADYSRVRFGKRLGSAIKVSVAPLFPGVGLIVFAPDIGPAWSARFGNGTHGTFTAERCERSKDDQCFWTGTFVSDTGRIQRTHVGLATGGKVTRIGQQVRAVDTGDRADVYPGGGGWDWLFLTVMWVVLLAMFVYWTFDGPIKALRRRPMHPIHDRQSR